MTVSQADNRFLSREKLSFTGFDRHQKKRLPKQPPLTLGY